MFLRALSMFPFRKSNRGVSGKSRMPKARISAQAKLMPIGMRHDPVLEMDSVPKLIRFARRIPIVMKSW